MEPILVRAGVLGPRDHRLAWRLGTDASSRPGVMLCPDCGHAAGRHTGPATDSRAATGERLSAEYECGKCNEATRNDDETWTACACAGWYPGLTVIRMTAETIAARAPCNQLADLPPFALTAPVRKRRLTQLTLF